MSYFFGRKVKFAKFNPYHDERGRFAEGPGGASEAEMAAGFDPADKGGYPHGAEDKGYYSLEGQARILDSRGDAAGAAKLRESAKAVQLTESGHRPLSTIAREIRRDWGSKVYFGAKPYLDALGSLHDIKDNYYEDSGKSVVAYLLGNMQSWRGDKAREIKAELKAILKKR